MVGLQVGGEWCLVSEGRVNTPILGSLYFNSLKTKKPFRRLFSSLDSPQPSTWVSLVILFFLSSNPAPLEPSIKAWCRKERFLIRSLEGDWICPDHCGIPQNYICYRMSI